MAGWMVVNGHLSAEPLQVGRASVALVPFGCARGDRTTGSHSIVHESQLLTTDRAAQAIADATALRQTLEGQVGKGQRTLWKPYLLRIHLGGLWPIRRTDDGDTPAAHGTMSEMRHLLERFGSGGIACRRLRPRRPATWGQSAVQRGSHARLSQIRVSYRLTA
jgi:hypothetical protein